MKKTSAPPLPGTAGRKKVTMTDVEIKLFYRQMMFRIVIEYLEKEFECFYGRFSEISFFDVDEFLHRKFVRVTFNMVLHCQTPEYEFCRLEGSVDILQYTGTVGNPAVTCTYLNPINGGFNRDE